MSLFQHCQQIYRESGHAGAAWKELELLFAYFRDIFHCVRPQVQEVVEETIRVLAGPDLPGGCFKVTVISKK